jgi:hypothetical protein
LAGYFLCATYSHIILFFLLISNLFIVKPKVLIVGNESIRKGTLYSYVGHKSQVKCLVSAYPKPIMTLRYNGDNIIPSSNYLEETVQGADNTVNFVFSLSLSLSRFLLASLEFKQFVLIYLFSFCSRTTSRARKKHLAIIAARPQTG